MKSIVLTRFGSYNVLEAASMALAIHVSLTLALLPIACVSSRGEIIEVEASADDGFHFPYLILLPGGDSAELLPFLLVEPNNTGSVSDDFEDHHRAARKMVGGSCIGYSIAHELHVPLLVPVFPRPETGWKIYTHALDRDAILITKGPLIRLDRQLAAMIHNAQALLKERGIEVHEKVLLTGFSASGTFANRFTFLHPELVKATACGGINGIPMLPMEQLEGTPLPYPLGLADFEVVSGREFDRETWNAIPQFLYMGADDDNDAVEYADGYSDEEREIVHSVIGENMLPDRWHTCRSVYEASGGRATVRTYEGIGHGTDRRINNDVVEFFRSAIGSTR